MNGLASISPSAVIGSRSGPTVTPHTQVFGYVWSITFASNVWADPTVIHDYSYVPGNWFGSATTWSDVWSSGYSKAWGQNVGPQPLMDCLTSNLYTTNGALPADGCLVEKVINFEYFESSCN